MKFVEFEDLADAVAVDDAQKSDVPCRLRDLAVQVRAVGERNEFTLEVPDRGPCVMEEWAALQLLQKRLRIPLDFLTERCGAGLAQQIIDHFLESEPPRALLLRLRDDGVATRVRAVLPGSFARFDNRDFLEVASEVSEEYGFKVQRFRLSDTSLECRLLSPDEEDAGVGAKDPHHFGVYARTSETGWCVPEAHFTVVRQICSNGAIGLSEEPMVRLNASSLHSLSRQRLLEQFRAGLNEGMRQRGKVIEVIRGARQRKVKVDDVDSELKRLHRVHNLSMRNLEIVREAFRRESRAEKSGETTSFELASALNRAAQFLPAEDAVRYEAAAWRVMAAGA